MRAGGRHRSQTGYWRGTHLRFAPRHSTMSTRHSYIDHTAFTSYFYGVDIMTTPISFAVKPPPAAAYRPSPLGNGNGSGRRAGPPSRRLFEQGDDDEDDDDRPRGSSSSRRPRDERGETRKEEPLVIAALPNRDWRESSRRTPTYRPDARQVTREDMITHERTGDGPQRSGIRRIVKEDVKIEQGTNEQPAIQVKREETIEDERSSTARTTTTTLDVKAEPLTEEEKLHREALAALLAGRSENETEDERAQRELRIEMQQNKLNLSEQDAFKRDMKTLPSEVSGSSDFLDAWSTDVQSTLDDYETIPVSAFGLAMARGMGWDPKGNDNTTVHEPKQRPQLLGLGATPMDSTIKPTHNKSKKDRQADRNAKSGRGFVATSLLVKKEREGSGTPVALRSGSPGGDKRGREEGDGREVKRERMDRDRNGRDRDYDTRRYETEEERAERKAKEREREYETEEQRARRKAREREREYETAEERAKRKAREREGERERGGEYETDEQRARRKARERERERDRERDRRR